MAFRINVSSNKARNQIYNGGKFLLASVEETGQERNSKKVFDRHFRYKQYVKSREWHEDSTTGIWSSKYLGLDPLSGFKKLEYQNPAYSGGKALGADPRLYSNAFTVQLAGCDYKCSYCYVPYQINQNKHKCKGVLFSAEQIVDSFLKIRKNNTVPLNVLRISGGNPTIVPEIIIEVVNIINQKKINDVYVWVDSNLSNSYYMKLLGQSFIDAISSPNIGIVGCFKGICASDFEKLTGCSAIDYEEQFETARFFLSTGCDFYVYLPTLTFLDDFEREMRSFFNKLLGLNHSLPARVELLRIINYPASVSNRAYWEQRKRLFPKISQESFHAYWYNVLMPERYRKESYPFFCCQARL